MIFLFDEGEAMNHPLAAKVVTRKRRATTKIRSFLVLALSFCLLGMSYSTFAQQPITKQIDSTNQSVLKPNVSLEAGQASENPTRKFGSPYPYTADQLGEMFLKVAALKDAPKDGAEILEIFNLPVDEFINIRPKGFSIAEKGFSLKANNDWYFTMSYIHLEKSKLARFVFAWPDDPTNTQVQYYSKPPTGLCIKSKIFIETLENTGWKLKSKIEVNDFPPSIIYQKNDSLELKIYFYKKDSCLLLVKMRWGKYLI